MPANRSKPASGAAAVLCLLLALPGPAPAIDRYEGTATPRGGGAVLYRETHWLGDAKDLPARVVLYTCPDGTAFARKRVWDGPTALAPRFDFVDGRDGYREGVRRVDAGLEAFWRERAGDEERRGAVVAAAASVFDAGFDALVRQHWTTLAAGDAVEAEFLLPSRLGFVDVRLRGHGDDPDPERLQLRMTLDAWYGFVAPRTDVTYRRSDRWLLRFEGIGTIRDADGRHQDVRIDFPPAGRISGVDRQEVDAALARPLAVRCGDP